MTRLVIRPAKRVSRAATRAILNHCIRRVQVELATTREHLEDAEASYLRGCCKDSGLAGEIVELRRREDSLSDELGYLCFKRDALTEADLKAVQQAEDEDDLTASSPAAKRAA